MYTWCYSGFGFGGVVVCQLVSCFIACYARMCPYFLDSDFMGGPLHLVDNGCDEEFV